MTIPVRTVIELNQDTFNQNVDQLASIKNFEQIALVIKSNAYGHGVKELSKFAQENEKINWLCTAGLAEAIELRNLGVTKSILVMSYFDSPLEIAAQLSIDCAVSSLDQAYLLNDAAVNTGKIISVHLKIDTGMGRIGILPGEALSLAQEITKLPGLKLVGAFTHLSHSAQPDSIFNYRQLDSFDKVLDDLEQNSIKILYSHAISSSGLHLKLKRKYTILRAGAACYGLIKSPTHYKAIRQRYPDFSINPILSWKTFITSIKTVPANWLISYDGQYRTKKPTKLAILPVGYWDGYPKELSNKGQVLIQKGHQLLLAHVRGTVSMNLTIIDVTHIPDVKQGDTVLLLGSHNIIRPDISAQKAGLITNELMTSLNLILVRKIINNTKTIEPQKTNLNAEASI